MAKVSVIIPGAGSGIRFGDKQNKVFAKIAGKAMFLRTLEAFATRDDVCQTIFVASPADMEEIKENFGGHLGFMGISLVEGGLTRSQSVRNALAEVSEEAELICVHDAARPYVAQTWIDSVFAEAEKSGAALLAVPIHGTIKRADDKQSVAETLPRENFQGLWEAQTPQVFRRDILMRAYETGQDATDDAALVEALGQQVKLVPGDLRNVKVTTRKDLDFASAVLNTLPKPHESRLAHPFREDLG